MSVIAPEMGIDLSTRMDCGDMGATAAFIADMLAEFDKEYDAVEAEIGAPTYRNLPAYRARLEPSASAFREATAALNAGILPW